ncbi:MAG: RraA family protein [Halobacteriaceae archaeon]
MVDNSTRYELDDEERAELRDLYRGLRVTDVTDGLDYNGFHDVNQLDRDIRPLSRDVEGFSHRFVGFAHTVRFHPTNRRRPPRMDTEEFDEWKGNWYGEHAGGPFTEELREGDVVVIEGHGTEVGFVGSNNSLSWRDAGAVGVVTNGGARDTDEILRQGLPVYTRHVNKTIRPGRLELDATQVPVNVGSCMVRPNDVVVADGDGVVVVPVEHAREVAADARHVQSADQDAREALYESVGLEKDFTLERPGARGED